MAQFTLTDRTPLHHYGQPWLVSLGTIAAFIIIALAPVALMVGRSFVVDGQVSFQAYGIFIEGRLLGLLAKSFSIAFSATMFSILFGLPVAIILGKFSFKARKIVCLLYLVPLFIPSHIHALSWIHLFGEQGVIVPLNSLYSGFGAALILALSYCPLLILLLITGISGIDRQLEEAALMHRPSASVFWRILLPLLRPHLLSGSVFVFIFSFFNYGVPSTLRVPSFPVEIFARYSAFYDEASAVALSMPLVLIALILLIVQGRYMDNKGYAILKPQRTNLQQFRSTICSIVCPLFAYLFVALTVILPLLSLLVQSGSLQSYQIAWQTSAREICSTIGIAAIGATVVTVLSFFFAVLLSRRETKASQALYYSTFLPFAFPATLFGIGLIRLWNTPSTQIVYSTACILVFAYIARFIPFGIHIIVARYRQISPGLYETALLCERSWIKRIAAINLPLMRPGLLTCWIVIFIFCAGELGATLLLIPPGWGTVTLKIYTLMHYGSGPLVAALALILITINLMAASCLAKLAGAQQIDAADVRIKGLVRS